MASSACLVNNTREKAPRGLVLIDQVTHLRILGQDARQTEVTELGISILVEEHVARLDVSVENLATGSALTLLQSLTQIGQHAPYEFLIDVLPEKRK